jgi:hypothetical protein
MRDGSDKEIIRGIFKTMLLLYVLFGSVLYLFCRLVMMINPPA